MFQKLNTFDYFVLHLFIPPIYNHFFWGEMYENTMKYQYVFVKFEEALCRIITFE